jgi:hypothetical protein
MTTPPLAAKRLLSQNSDLRRSGVWNWSIPAHTVRLETGSLFNCCPNAGVCARVCYAKFGTYRFSNVLARHTANLEYFLYWPVEWQAHMTEELQHKRFLPSGKPHDLPGDPADLWLSDWIHGGGRAVRIHDAGDFFNDHYFLAWCEIAQSLPHILFYAYTKEVSMVTRLNGIIPGNLRLLFSYGGLEDHLIDREQHRNADVFPNLEELLAAGYTDQGDSDLLAVCAPTNKIGIVANNLPVPNKRFAGATMSSLMAEKAQQKV